MKCAEFGTFKGNFCAILYYLSIALKCVTCMSTTTVFYNLYSPFASKQWTATSLRIYSPACCQIKEF